MRPADALWQRNTGHVNPMLRRQHVRFDVWVASSLLEAVRGTVELRFVAISTGDEVLPRRQLDVDIQPNGTTELLAKEELDISGIAGPFVIHATLSAASPAGGGLVSAVSWPEPIKYLDFPDRGLSVAARRTGDGIVATFETKRPIKALVLDEKPGVSLSDNGFDVVPGETKTIEIKGPGTSEGWTFTYIGCHGRGSVLE